MTMNKLNELAEKIIQKKTFIYSRNSEALFPSVKCFNRKINGIPRTKWVQIGLNTQRKHQQKSLK